MAEMFLGRPLFPGMSLLMHHRNANFNVYNLGKTEADQVDRIMKVLGDFSEERWSGVTDLPHYLHFTESVKRNPLFNGNNSLKVTSIY